MRFGGFGFNKQFGFGAPTPVRSSGGGGLGPELWPQPDFAASAGLTFTAYDGAPPSVSGGQLLFGDGSQDGYVNCGAVVSEVGTYRIASTSANAAGNYNVQIGGLATEGVVFDGTATSTETHDLVIADVGDGKVYISNAYIGQTLDDFSVKKVG